MQAALDAALSGTLKGDAERQAEKEQDNYDPPGAPASRREQKFTLEPFEQIKLPTGGDGASKNSFPRPGTGVLTWRFAGRSNHSRQWIWDFMFRLVREWERTPRRASARRLYCRGRRRQASESVRSDSKRKIQTCPRLFRFTLISAAPNFGVGQRDQRALIASVNAVGVSRLDHCRHAGADPRRRRRKRGRNAPIRR